MITLPPRQQIVADKICAGLSTMEIARDMQIGEGTVKDHLTKLYKKLGVKSRAQAIICLLKKDENQLEFPA